MTNCRAVDVGGGGEVGGGGGGGGELLLPALQALQQHILVNTIHCKKRLLVFPFPAGMSLIKLSLAGKN
jgi:hypothetical protein